MKTFFIRNVQIFSCDEKIIIDAILAINGELKKCGVNQLQVPDVLGSFATLHI